MEFRETGKAYASKKKIDNRRKVCNYEIIVSSLMALRFWIRRLFPSAFALLGLLLLFIQAIKHPSHMSQLPVGSFVVLLTLAGFCFNWARTNAPLTTERERLDVKLAGLDFFASSLLTLIASVFTLIPEHSSSIIMHMVHIGYFMHLILLALAYFFAWLGLCQMIRHYPDSSLNRNNNH